MSRPVAARARRHREAQSGYALLLAIFLVATMVLFAAAAVPRVLTEGRRERETEMIWRGKQYVRAIRLYYQKNGHYPASLEDLTRPDAAGVHFLRRAYKDPMNKVDGSWRLIYVSPSGQLTGSVRYHSLQEMAADLGLTNPAQPSATSPGSTQKPPDKPMAPSSPSASSSAQPQPGSLGLQPVEGQVMGGSVIGVGSKVKQRSLRVYEGGDTYKQWEFIWNPLANGIAISSPATTKPAAGTGAGSRAGNAQGTAGPSNNPSGASGSQPNQPAGPTPPPESQPTQATPQP